MKKFSRLCRPVHDGRAMAGQGIQSSGDRLEIRHFVISYFRVFVINLFFFLDFDICYSNFTSAEGIFCGKTAAY